MFYGLFAAESYIEWFSSGKGGSELFGMFPLLITFFKNNILIFFFFVGYVLVDTGMEMTNNLFEEHMEKEEV